MKELELIQFPKFVQGDGTLCVYECGRYVGFPIKRVFTVSARKGIVRGDHAHKECTQLLVCVSGVIQVTCDDGADCSEYVLEDMNSGLLIPPGIWARETYLTDNALLMVLCDRAYEAEEYIRDYDEFRRFVGL